MERAWVTEELSRANFRTFQIDGDLPAWNCWWETDTCPAASELDRQTYTNHRMMRRPSRCRSFRSRRSISFTSCFELFQFWFSTRNFSGCQFKATTTWPPFKLFLTNCSLLKQPSKFSASPLPQSSTTECQSRSIRFIRLCLDTRQVTKPISRLRKDALVDYACAPVCLRDYLIRER